MIWAKGQAQSDSVHIGKLAEELQGYLDSYI